MKTSRRKYIKRLVHLSILITLMIFITVICAENSDLIILKNKYVEVGIINDLGGRIVLLRVPGRENILISDEDVWKNPKKYKPQISPFTDFSAFNGHITWVGPQAEWWTHQTLNKQRLERQADWPPDPYLIYGKNEIVSRSDTSIIMIGTPSPITGLKVTKEVSINSKGQVFIKSTAENVSTDKVSWDLWMLTRLDGFANAYVPVSKAGIKQLVKVDDSTSQITPYMIVDGYFTFVPSLPVDDKSEQVQEVHLTPSSNYIAGFNAGQMLLITFSKLEDYLIHPNHGQVELYNYINAKGDDTLLELELHGEYKTLVPGETMSLIETWEVLPYNGKKDIPDQIEFIKSNIIHQ